MNNSKEQNIIVVDAADLLNKIREVIRAEVALNNRNNEPVSYTTNGLTEKPLYKAHEVCMMMDISRQTLHTWVKEGLLKKHKVRSRVYFLFSDIQALIKSKDSDLFTQ